MAGVLRLEGNQVELTVRAWDGNDLVGEGTHQRVIIEEARFLKRLADKAAAQPPKMQK